jgi:Domain of unknown function (DUF1707)
MAGNTTIRACDADRDRTAAALCEHLAAGRLTVEEFDERLDQAFAAKTLGELDEVMTDLPEANPGRLPGALVDYSDAGPPLTRLPPPGSIEAGPGSYSTAWRAAWSTWLMISLFVFVLWLAGGASGSLWFVWVTLALGVVLLVRRITGAPVRTKRRPARSRRHRRYGVHDPSLE